MAALISQAAGLLLATMAIGQQAGNSVSVADCVIQPPPTGISSSREAAARLADTADEQCVGWRPAAETPMTIELRWPDAVVMDVVACHWRRMPASYRVEVGDAGGWRSVAEVEDNKVLNDKISLHQFA